MRVILVTVGLLLASASAAFAELDTALKMKSQCRGVADTPLIQAPSGADAVRLFTLDDGLCWGTFETLLFTLTLRESEGVKKPLFELCLPKGGTKGVTPPQLVAVFMRYIEQHPEKLHDTFISVALTAFSTSFPCPVTIPAR